MLTFVVPVRHQASVPDWGVVKRNLAETLASLARQSRPGWRAVLVANDGADLPALPSGVTVVRVDLPRPAMPDPRVNQEAFNEVVRADKGRRVLAGLTDVAAHDYVMVVDYDDWVSRRLAEIAEATSGAGWYIQHGFVYDGGRLAYLHRNFNELCGSSFIVRRDHLDIPPALDAASETSVRRHLGSHKFLRHDLQTRGTPLEPLTIPGAVYRIGTPGSSTNSTTVLRQMLPLRQPLRCAYGLTRLRPMTSTIRDEFGVAATPK